MTYQNYNLSIIYMSRLYHFYSMMGPEEQSTLQVTHIRLKSKLKLLSISDLTLPV